MIDNPVFIHFPTRHGDARGWFEESYTARRFAEHGVDQPFVQDNQSYSQPRFTLRGLHYQAPPHGQAKLVRCLRGAIFDVAVDLRAQSPTYGRWVGAILSRNNGAQLYVPVGFGHGFVTLQDDCDVAYKVTEYYAPQCDGGVAWDDPDIGIDWPMDGLPVLSAKDRDLPRLARFQSPFAYDGRPLRALGPGHFGNV